MMERHNKKILEEFDKNTRAVRCLEKAVIQQTNTFDRLRGSLNSLINTLESNARESKRREEDRELEERRRWREDRKRRTEDQTDRPEKRNRIEKSENAETSPRLRSVLGNFNKFNKKKH